MNTIQATVNVRLLNKASRLFTGSLKGRIIEILQNARRAGATEVHITNKDGVVTVRDNGRGISDLSKLLNLGGSGWEEALDVSRRRSNRFAANRFQRSMPLRNEKRLRLLPADGRWRTDLAISRRAAPAASGTMVYLVGRCRGNRAACRRGLVGRACL